MAQFILSLVRHGQTHQNKDNIIQGQMDVPLSTLGLHQAILLGYRLKNECYSHVFSSDLLRAKQTAQAIVNLNCSRTSIIEEPKLRERKFGVVEGKPFSKLKELSQKENQTIPTYTPPGGETVEQVHERAVEFFQELCEFLLRIVGKSHGSCGEVKSNSRTVSDAKEIDIRQEDKRSLPCVKNGFSFSQDQITTDHMMRQRSLSDSFLNKFPTKQPKELNKKTISLLCDKTKKCPSLESIEIAKHYSKINVLVVSHGGLIKELIKYFVWVLGCKIPGGNANALRISPNTGLSVFSVTVSQTEKLSVMLDCIRIHDKEHLLEN